MVEERGTSVGNPDDVVVLAEPKPDAAERFRFTFLHQQRDRFLDIVAFIRSRELATECGQVDVLSFELVTMGQPIADFANELFAADSYRATAEPGSRSVTARAPISRIVRR